MGNFTIHEATLHALIEQKAHYWLDFLNRLVGAPSITGKEGGCQGMVRQAMKDKGFYERDVLCDSTPPFHETNRTYFDRPNIVGRVSGKGDSDFILNAHIDTAPVEDEDSWDFPPFEPTVKDGRLYGRGALDDKAGVAMLLLLAEAFQEADLELPGDIILQSVIEDEDSGNGTLACTRAGYHANAAIIIDGTWPQRIIDAHLGQLWLTFNITGDPTPSCSCGRGSNPIKMANTLLCRLENWATQSCLKGEWEGISTPYFISPGTFHSGKWNGATPEQCTMSCQIGFPPPHTPKTIQAEVDKIIKELPATSLNRIEYVVGELCTAPFANRDNALVGILKGTISRMRPDDLEPKNVAVTGHCDLRHLVTGSGAPAAACLYGPGGGENPHVRNECYILEHFIPVAQTISSAILAWYDREAWNSTRSKE
mgnify:CR=1 FL=1